MNQMISYDCCFEAHWLSHWHPYWCLAIVLICSGFSQKILVWTRNPINFHNQVFHNLFQKGRRLPHTRHLESSLAASSAEQRSTPLRRTLKLEWLGKRYSRSHHTIKAETRYVAELLLLTLKQLHRALSPINFQHAGALTTFLSVR